MKLDSELKVLFVCVGNTCRSPLAQQITAELLSQSNLKVSVSSVGLQATEGQPMNQLAIEALTNLGYKANQHLASKITPADVESADLVLTMTQDISERTLPLVEGSFQKTFTVREFSKLIKTMVQDSENGETFAEHVNSLNLLRVKESVSDLDIADPLGSGAGAYRELAEELDRFAQDFLIWLHN